MKTELLQPKIRSNLRIKAGKLYYTVNRYKEWYFGNVKFAKNRSNKLLKNIVFTHQTPL
ncbi:hypothetical protein LCL95_04470 [Bacillus timonensis]|nr:hypothetical protein [Bacillus timonensis]